jgi:hypothetical protein
MSKIKNMSRGGWIVIGILIAMMLVPSGVAVAKALKYTGIEGTSTNKADVTGDSQLLTTETDPTDIIQTDATEFTDNFDVIYTPPAGRSGIIDQVHVSALPGTNGFIQWYVGQSSCEDNYGTIDYVDLTTPGLTVSPLTPGIVVPPGYEFCAEEATGVSAYVSAFGYSVPSADTPSSPLVRSANALALRP